MNIFTRISNGWKMGIRSMAVIQDHPKMLLFPVMSGLAISGIIASFVLTFIVGSGLLTGHWDMSQWENSNWVIQTNETYSTIALFIFYLVSYFIAIFFNVALVYNARRVFEGQQVSIRKGIEFSGQRIVNIFSWAVLASTVGVILKAIEERLGFVGQLVSGLLGMAWSITTYFVVPVLAFEEIGPFEALRRSTDIIKDKWGASIGAGFSFGAFHILGVIAAIAGGIILGLIHPILGVLSGLSILMLVFTITAAARNVFLAAVYEHTQGNTPKEFEGAMLDSIFAPKGRH